MSDWTMIYSTDGFGSVSTGSIINLDQAVRAGADVKVVYNSGPGIWWSRYCPAVSTRGSGSSRIVTATHMVAADTENAGEHVEFAAPFVIEYHIYNSNGKRVMNKGGESRTDVVPMRWFVRNYTPGLSAVIQSALAFIDVRRDP